MNRVVWYPGHELILEQIVRAENCRLVDGPDRECAGRVQQQLVARGYIAGLRPGLSVLRLDPSLTIDREDLTGFLATLEEVLNDE
jgi:4-aminobutyrate aminotransferase-like enzyme